jgi:hypothetical protein
MVERRSWNRILAQAQACHVSQLVNKLLSVVHFYSTVHSVFAAFA